MPDGLDSDSVYPNKREPSSSSPRLSFEQVFHAEGAFVARTLGFLGVREAAIEDACQEVFVVIHRRTPELDALSLRAYLRQTCVHVAHNQRRSLRRRPEDAVAEPPEVATEASQYAVAETNQLWQRLLALLEGIPGVQRAAFVLHEIEQLTLAEVAAALGCPLQTAYSRLQSARTKLAKSLGDPLSPVETEPQGTSDKPL